jgi:hypothetical protein
MVTINGRGYDFLLDSGAAGISVDPGAAAKIGLELFGKEKNAMNAGSFDTARGKIATMAVGPLTMHDVYVDTAPVVEFADGVKCLGLLGFDFLAELGVRIDYVNHAVTASRWGAYEPPSGRDFLTIPIRLNNETPLFRRRSTVRPPNGSPSIPVPARRSCSSTISRGDTPKRCPDETPNRASHRSSSRASAGRSKRSRINSPRSTSRTSGSSISSAMS